MARYSVVWAADVQNDFIQQWITSDSSGRRRLTEIANVIDQELAVAPENAGQTLPSEPALHLWRLPGFSPSVSAVFEVLPHDRIVRVLRISVATR